MTEDIAHSAKRLALESLLGLSVGDAVGAAREGSGELLDAQTEIVLQPGTLSWTDDTQMALSIIDVLFRFGTIEQDALAAAFAERFEPYRGYGAGAYRLLSQIREGGSWRELAPQMFSGGSYGNGSAMRVAPLGAFLFDQDANRVVREAEASAEVTHSHSEAKQGAAAIALAAWIAARSRGAPAPRGSAVFEEILSHLRGSDGVIDGVRRAAELAPTAPLGEAVGLLGNGSWVRCQDTVPLALWLALSHLDDYETAILLAVRAGGDTDTVAAMVGGILAARLGAAAVPGEWLVRAEPLPGAFRIA